jgi:hypothetical protein
MMTGRLIGTLLVFGILHGELPAAGPRGQAQIVSTAGASLDQLLAPVALYPDQLLGQILMSATVPAKVVEFDRWLTANQSLKGSELQDAAVAGGFDPSLVALAQFPQVVARMAVQIDWTTDVGKAFGSNRSAVFEVIQRLRQQATTVGTLKTTAQQQVETRTTSAGQEVIVIEPANPQVVYVPQYNPTVVYTQAPTTTTTVIIKEEDDDDEAAAAVAAGLIGFTAGVAIGASMDNHYYYGPYGWHGGGYMYNDAWDDYYDAREDARDDWMDHREDIVEDRGDVARDRQEERSDRVESTQQQRTERRETSQQQRTERRESAGQQRTERAQSGTAAQTQGATQSRTSRTGSTQARGYDSSDRATQRSSGSGAFSGYASGKSTRSASDRGNRSRSSSRSSSGGRRR